MDIKELLPFSQLLIDACRASLPAEESTIIIDRFGLKSGKPLRYSEIENNFGMNKRALKSIIKRGILKIRAEDLKQRDQGNTTHPAVHLMKYLLSNIDQDTEGNVDYQGFINRELPLIAGSKKTRQLIEALLGYPGRGKTVREMFDEVLNHVFWPKNPKVLTENDLETIKPGLYQGDKNNFFTGYFYSMKMDREIRYISLIHLHFLLNLEYSDKVSNYYECPFMVKSLKNKNAFIFPHAFYTNRDNQGVVVKILTLNDMAKKSYRTDLASIRKFCSQNCYGMLVTDGKISMQQVMKRKVNHEFEQNLLSCLEKGALSKQLLQSLINKFHADELDVLSLAFRHKLIWEPNLVNNVLYAPNPPQS